jgi:signal transduction histidine kinase
MNIFRQLRWKLTLNYTFVTVGTLLVITLVLGGILLIRIFQATVYLPPGYSPTNYIDGFMNVENETSSYLYYCQTLSQTPQDLKLVNRMLTKMQSVFAQYQLFRIEQVKVTASTMAELRIAVFKPDGTLLGTSVPDDPAFRDQVGKVFDPTRVPGLDKPFRAALAGATDPNLLYTEVEKDQRYVFAAPCFNRSGENPKQVTGVIAILIDAVPTQADIPPYLIDVAGRGLVVFLLFSGVIGAVFGYFFSHGLVKRLDHLSSTTDRWSEGDFSHYLDDATGDEISQFAQRLNNMARQLQSLLRRRQDMAVSEERTRLARDLHDAVTQTLFSATLIADVLPDIWQANENEGKRRLEELRQLTRGALAEMRTLLVELRPNALVEVPLSTLLRQLSEALTGRSGIDIQASSEGERKLPPDVQVALYRIAQEALNNVVKHSRASQAAVLLRLGDQVRLSVTDNGAGFDPASVTADHLGLKIMSERSQAIGAKFSLYSEPGEGTQVTVTWQDKEIP